MQEDDPRRDLLATVITQWRQVWSRTDCASMRFKLNRIGAFAEGAVTRLKWGDHGGLPARQTGTEYFDQREPRSSGLGRAGTALV